MKNFSFIAFLVFAMSFFFVSCDSAYELDKLAEQIPNGDKNPEENPNKDQEGDKGTVLDKTYGNVDQEWPSRIYLQTQQGDTAIFEVNLPFEYTFGQDEYTKTNTSEASSFVEILTADTTSTQWQADGKGNFLRKVTYTRRVVFSKFERELTATWWEAYRIINGKQENFLSGKIANPYVTNLEQDYYEYVNEEKKYEREKNNISLSFVFHKKNYEIKATTFVDRFLGEVEGENGENKDPENQEPEKMPAAQVYIEDDVQFMYWTKVFDVNANRWRDALMFKSSSYYYPVVDGTLYKVKASSIAKTDKYNGVVFAKGSYLPALITVDGAGWTTIGQYSDGTPITQSHDMKNAEIDGIKNFSQTDHAKVTPFVKVSVEEKTYDGKQFWSINGIDVNGKIFASYTVAEK